MMNAAPERNLLKVFRIIPSPARVEVLAYILSKKTPVTTVEIFLALKSKHFPITCKHIADVLRLFHARGIIQEIDSVRTHKKGRPQMRFTIHSIAGDFNFEL